jgi:ATPase family protein associated with various cellular activities (AAA)
MSRHFSGLAGQILQPELQPGDHLCYSGHGLPQRLIEKYRPSRIEDFLGLDQVKTELRNFVADPYSKSWLFVGPSGFGKSAMARVVMEEVTAGDPGLWAHVARYHYVPARACKIDLVNSIASELRYSPRNGKFHGVLVDEADTMSQEAQDAFLSVLDGSYRMPPSIFIFTCNVEEDDEKKPKKKRYVPKGLDSRFFTRCRKLDFSLHGAAKKIAAWLEQIWDLETEYALPRPNCLSLVNEARSNIRLALTNLEGEIGKRQKPVLKPSPNQPKTPPKIAPNQS